MILSLFRLFIADFASWVAMIATPGRPGGGWLESQGKQESCSKNQVSCLGDFRKISRGVGRIVFGLGPWPIPNPAPTSKARGAGSPGEDVGDARYGSIGVRGITTGVAMTRRGARPARRRPRSRPGEGGPHALPAVDARPGHGRHDRGGHDPVDRTGTPRSVGRRVGGLGERQGGAPSAGVGAVPSTPRPPRRQS